MSIEAMRQALEALQTNNKAWKQLADSGDAGFWEAEEQPFYETSAKAITALRAAIEQAEKPRQWKGLTADEIWQCNTTPPGSEVGYHICMAHQNVLDFAEAIEAKLKEKNT